MPAIEMGAWAGKERGLSIQHCVCTEVLPRALIIHLDTWHLFFNKTIWFPPHGGSGLLGVGGC